MAKIMLLTIFLISAVGVTLSAPQNSDSELDTYNKKDVVIGEGQYTFYTDHVTWGEARRRCNKKGSKLAEIISPKELKDLQAELRLTRDYDNAWVGGRGAQTDEDKSCGFYWNHKGDEISDSMPVKDVDGACVPGSSRKFLRVEIDATDGLKARHGFSVLPYICQP